MKQFFSVIFLMVSLLSLAQESTKASLWINGSLVGPVAESYRMATGDIYGNIQPFKGGLLQDEKLCLLAGLFYIKPWTRDAAINTWNGAGLLYPEISKNTLLAQLDLVDEELMIRGQYWDKIIWAIGAWDYYLYAGYKTFLKTAYSAMVNTLEKLEEEEFSDELGLFRGGSVYGDGVAAYPDVYTGAKHSEESGTYSGIPEWVDANPHLRAKKGFGLPMHALSTNCIYYRVYEVLPLMEKELSMEVSKSWISRSGKLKKAINRQFWDEQRGTYNYLVDPFGGSDAQEGLGLAFVILFDIADENQTTSILKNFKTTPSGIACVYPSFTRYVNPEFNSYGRHSGTVWPHVQGFWADAMKKTDRMDLFMTEFDKLQSHALRDRQFAEIYHPDTGEIYGGIQEPTLGSWEEWYCADRQTWSASAYLRMLFRGFLGMSFTAEGISFEPFLPEGINDLRLTDVPYRDGVLDIHILGSGSEIQSFKINGQTAEPFLIENASGRQCIEITLQ